MATIALRQALLRLEHVPPRGRRQTPLAVWGSMVALVTISDCTITSTKPNALPFSVLTQPWISASLNAPANPALVSSVYDAEDIAGIASLDDGDILLATDAQARRAKFFVLVGRQYEQEGRAVK